MDQYKELLIEHCDKVAFGIVGVITVLILLLTGTGRDVVGESQQDIKKYGERIKEIANKQVMIPDPTIPPIERTVATRWGKTALSTHPFRPFLMYCQPAVVRLFSEKIQENLEHTKPVIQELAVQRSAELKKPVVKLRAVLGKLANVRVTEVVVLRRTVPVGEEKAQEEFQPVGTADLSGGAASGGEVVFVDTNVAPGNRYIYALRSTAEPTDKTKRWAEGSQQVQVSDPFPRESQCPDFAVPYDLRIRFSQGQLAEAAEQAGTGYFDVEYYDYEKGEIVRERLIKLTEWLKRARPPDSALLPHTKYFLMIMRKTEKGLVAVLKNVDQPTDRINLRLDTWHPASIVLPEPCSTEAKKKEVAAQPPQKTAAGAKGKAKKASSGKKPGKTTKKQPKATTGAKKKAKSEEPQKTGPFK